jgi:hypothetical protein
MNANPYAHRLRRRIRHSCRRPERLNVWIRMRLLFVRMNGLHNGLHFGRGKKHATKARHLRQRRNFPERCVSGIGPCSFWSQSVFEKSGDGVRPSSGAAGWALQAHLKCPRPPPLQCCCVPPWRDAPRRHRLRDRSEFSNRLSAESECLIRGLRCLCHCLLFGASRPRSGLVHSPGLARQASSCCAWSALGRFESRAECRLLGMSRKNMGKSSLSFGAGEASD